MVRQDQQGREVTGKRTATRSDHFSLPPPASAFWPPHFPSPLAKFRHVRSALLPRWERGWFGVFGPCPSWGATLTNYEYGSSSFLLIFIASSPIPGQLPSSERDLIFVRSNSQCQLISSHLLPCGPGHTLLTSSSIVLVLCRKPTAPV